MNATAPKPKAKRPPAVKANRPQYFADPYRPANVNIPDPDFAPARPIRPPTPPFNAEAEIRAMGERLRWLVAHDNDAPRFMLERIDALAHEHDTATEIAEERDNDAVAAATELIEAEGKIEDLESHIGKLVELIGDMSNTLTPDEQDEPENVSAFMEGYDRRVMALEQYITDNMLRDLG